MSEYQEKHAVSRLVGAPPGYIGYDEGGQLTEAVRRRPYSIVLLDEIEKAHPDVFNILLQVLDDGRLTDNKGRVVNFKNTIIIMTSNMGAHLIQEKFDGFENKSNNEQFDIIENTKTEVFEVLKKSIRPEFLKRIYETIMFQPLTRDNIRDIVKIQFKSLQNRLKDNKIKLLPTDRALDLIAHLGYDPQFGARPVKRVIQRKVLNELSKSILGGTVGLNSVIELDVVDGTLTFKTISEEVESV
jgi:ATP-dependent Clp protease ATP-binding subunit ClpB